MNNPTTFRFPFGLDKIFYGWWIVGACFFISLYVGAVIFYGFTAFIEPLVREFGWSYTQVSFASSLRGVEMSLLAPLVGFLVDRLGSRRLIFWGVITIGVGFILLSLTQSLWMFYAGFILIAFGGGGCTAVVLSQVVACWFQRDVGKALGVMTSGVGASGLMIPVIVWLIDALGWRTAMVVLGGGMWAIGIPLSFVIRDTPEGCGLHPDGREPVAPAAGKTKETTGPAAGVQEYSFREALKHRAFLFLALGEGVRMMAVSAVIIHIMPYLNLLGIPRTTAGLLAAATTVLSIAGRFCFGWLADFIDKRYIIAVCFAMMGLGLLALCRVDAFWFMILFLVLFPSGFGGAMVLRGAIVRDYYGRGSFGRLLGIVMGVSAVGGVIGPTLAGYAFDTQGSYIFIWVTLAVAIALATVLLLSMGPKDGRAPS
jgi:MFS family permease